MRFVYSDDIITDAETGRVVRYSADDLVAYGHRPACYETALNDAKAG